MQIDHSKSQHTDDKLSLKWAWSCHVIHFKFQGPKHTSVITKAKNDVSPPNGRGYDNVTCSKILPFAVMQRVARVRQRQRSYLWYNTVLWQTDRETDTRRQHTPHKYSGVQQNCFTFSGSSLIHPVPYLGFAFGTCSFIRAVPLQTLPAPMLVRKCQELSRNGGSLTWDPYTPNRRGFGYRRGCSIVMQLFDRKYRRFDDNLLIDRRFADTGRTFRRHILDISPTNMCQCSIAKMTVNLVQMLALNAEATDTRPSVEGEQFSNEPWQTVKFLGQALKTCQK